MKKMIVSILAIASLALTGCQQDNNSDNSPAKTNDNRPPMTNNLGTNQTMTTNQGQPPVMTNAPAGQP